ncbi:MAG: 5'-methylthioadenosine/adenosylhomocysteine nucleosidase [Atopobiaceae bacterium]|nr:5'-methylthioadenosine/adenosylhomocysteine nucleosidase [Atopobiaceae bacterium]
MKLGIIGAMEVEVALLKEELDDVRVVRAGSHDVYCGRLRGLEVAVVRSGVGKVFAAMCTQALIDVCAPDAIVNTGIAGSLDPSIDIGDFVVATDCIQHDYDVTAAGYFDLGIVPGMPSLGVVANESLRTKLVAAARQTVPDAGVFEGRIASGDQFVADDERKRFIRGRFSALCCEMESAPIAQVSWANGVPFGIVRAISDKADSTSVEEYPANEEDIALRCARVILELAPMLT